MSRIHEALKKAAQEKTAHLAAGERADVAAATVDIHGSVLSMPHGPEPTVRETWTSEGGGVSPPQPLAPSALGRCDLAFLRLGLCGLSGRYW